jgi:hypothetical protein
VKAYWSETRPNGAPIEVGTFCRVLDLEDGTNPIFTYGKTEAEVMEKIERNNANAQMTLARRAQPVSAAPGVALPPAAPRARMSADEVLAATADLDNPGRAGAAITRLVQDETGIDFSRMALNNFATMAMKWEESNPDFYPHPGNKRMLVDQAKAHAGNDLTRITPEILTQAFTELQNGGYLLDELGGLETPNPQTPSTFPAEIPVQRTERPRRSFSTGARGTSFSASQTAPPRTLKYTESQIRTMPLSKSEALLRDNDKDYLEACEFYFPTQQRATV